MTYDTTFHTVTAGLDLKPSEKLELTLDAAWNDAEAGLDPFRFLEGEAFAPPAPNQSYDFSLTHTYSDLDTTYMEAGLEARYRVSPLLFVRGGYRYLDFDDQEIYLYDRSGSLTLWSAGLGWSF